MEKRFPWRDGGEIMIAFDSESDGENEVAKNSSVRRRIKQSMVSVETSNTKLSGITVFEGTQKKKIINKTEIGPLIFFLGSASLIIASVLTFGGVGVNPLKSGHTVFLRSYWNLPELVEYPNGTFVIDKESCQSCCYDLNLRYDGNNVNDPYSAEYAPVWDLFHYWTCHDIGCVGYEFDCSNVTSYVNNDGVIHPRGNSIRGCSVGQQIRLVGSFNFEPPEEVAEIDPSIDPDTTYQFTCSAVGRVALDGVATDAPTYPPNLVPAPTNYPTAFPTTLNPTSFPTLSPTQYPTSVSPTKFPTTSAPTPFPTLPTNNPTTASPVTPSPTTKAPTLSPTTASPVTPSPTTKAPTLSPTTASPTTLSPVTLSPTTASPITASPTTRSPSTFSPTQPTLETGVPTAAPTLQDELGNEDPLIVDNLAWVGGVAGVSTSTIVAGMLNFIMIF